MNNVYKITILTPTAITNGETIDSFEYWISGNFVYRLDLNEILNYLIKKFPEAIDKISDWVDHKEEIINQNVNIARHNFQLNIFDFIHKYLKKPEINQWLKQEIIKNNFIKYKIPSYLNQNYSKQISTHIKTPSNQVYIPGSTIKGIIRTSLLNDYLYSIFDSNDNDKINDLKKNLSLISKKEKNDKNNNKLTQSFIYDFFKFRSGDYDAKNDIMKFIRVSDTNSLDPTDACEVVHPVILTRKGREQQGQLNALELLKPGTMFEFTIDIDIDFLRNTINAKNTDSKLKEHDKVYLENSLKLFNLTSNEIEKNPNSLLIKKVYKTIEDSLYNYSIFISEKNDDFIKNNKQIKEPHYDENDVLAQIGWGTGYHTKTVLFNFLNKYWKEDKSLKEIYKKIFQTNNIIRKSKNNTQNTEINLDDFPTSRRLIKINNFYQQLGWVKIERIQ